MFLWKNKLLPIIAGTESEEDLGRNFGIPPENKSAKLTEARAPAADALGPTVSFLCDVPSSNTQCKENKQ